MICIGTTCLSSIALGGHQWITFQTPSSSPLPFKSRYGLFKKCDADPFDMKEDHIDWHCRAFPQRSLDCRRKPRKGPDGDDALLLFRKDESDAWTRARSALSIMMGFDPEDTFDEVEESPISVSDVNPSLTKTFAEEHFGFCELWRTSGYLAQLSLIFSIASLIGILVILVPPFAGRKRREQGWKLIAGLIGLCVLTECAAASLIAHLYNTDNRFWGGSRLGTSFILATVAWAVNAILCFALIIVGVSGIARDHSGYSPIPPTHD